MGITCPEDAGCVPRPMSSELFCLKGDENAESIAQRDFEKLVAPWKITRHFLDVLHNVYLAMGNRDHVMCHRWLQKLVHPAKTESILNFEIT